MTLVVELKRKCEGGNVEARVCGPSGARGRNILAQRSMRRVERVIPIIRGMLEMKYEHCGGVNVEFVQGEYVR